MNAAHLHLVLNHLPILGAALSLPVLVLAMLRRREVGVMYAAALLLAIAGAGGVIAKETGEDAEESVEDLPGVSEAALHEHEDRADIAVPIGVVTGIFAVVVAGLSARRGSVPLPAAAVLLACNVATAGAMGAVGYSGGPIRHSEIRGDSAGSGVAEAENEQGERGEAEEH